MYARPAALLLCLFAVTACHGKKVSSSVKKTADRSRRLTILAASEAGNIRDADARLTRQLNIAEQVLQRFGNEDALTVLAEAEKTLKSVGPQLSSHARISGWVSVSQLARRAVGTEAAKAATAEAQRELEALPNLAERCQYVMGVAEEVSQLQGEADAAAVLVKGGQWVASIEGDTERRNARLAFAVALFNLDAYEGGVATLQLERDPSWSSDTMLALASPPPADNDVSVSNKLSNAYGRPVAYEQVFQGSTQNSRAAH